MIDRAFLCIFLGLFLIVGSLFIAFYQDSFEGIPVWVFIGGLFFFFIAAVLFNEHKKRDEHLRQLAKKYQQAKEDALEPQEDRQEMVGRMVVDDTVPGRLVIVKDQRKSSKPIFLKNSESEKEKNVG